MERSREVGVTGGYYAGLCITSLSIADADYEALLDDYVDDWEEGDSNYDSEEDDEILELDEPIATSELKDKRRKKVGLWIRKANLLYLPVWFRLSSELHSSLSRVSLPTRRFDLLVAIIVARRGLSRRMWTARAGFGSPLAMGL